MTQRIDDLYNLAALLGSEIVENEAVMSRMQSFETKDDSLAYVLKAAIKVALYEKVSNGDYVDSINLTPFFKNYNLYATPKVVDRSDYVMPSNKSILSEPDPDGAQIELVQHQWNSGDLNGHQPIWIMIPGQTYYDLYPGWEAISYSSSSQCMANPDVDRDYSNFSNGVPASCSYSLGASIPSVPSGDPSSGNYFILTSVGAGAAPVWVQGSNEYSLVGHTHSYIPTTEKGANSGVAELN